MKNILLARCDVNANIGMGHIRRLSNICEKLKKEFNIIFILDKKNDYSENLNKFKKIYLYENNENFSNTDEINKLKKIFLEYKPELFIVDDYRFNISIEKKIRNYCKLIVIDDLANRKHKCDLLIDFGWYRNKTYKRYNKLINKDAKLLLGPKYFPLDNKFKIKKGKVINTKKNFLIYFGGGNFPKNTILFINKLFLILKKIYKNNFIINLVVGPYNDEFKSLEINRKYLKIHRSKRDLGNIFRNSSICFCAVNSSIYKLQYLNKHSDTFLLFTNKNQKIIKPYLNDLGYFNHNSLDNLNYFKIRKFIYERKRSNKIIPPKIFTDNLGAYRVAEYIKKEFSNKCLYNLVDDSLIYKYYKLRNEKNNRIYSLNSDKILFNNHIYWWHNSKNIKKFYLKNNNKILFYFFIENLNKINNIGFITTKKINLTHLINAYQFLTSKLKNIVGYVNTKNLIFIFLNKQFNFKILKKIKIKKELFYLMKR